jgi:predicted transcriptional regulator
LSFNRKRDRIQIIAEILGICRTPQTQTCIRRQTSISYEVLQSCIIQLQMRQWLLKVDAEDGQRRLEITEKGAVFLDKWVELQQLAGLKNKKRSVDLQTVKASYR